MKRHLAPFLVAAFLVAGLHLQANSQSLDVPFVPTAQQAVDAMLDIANVKEGDVLYDLGSGDGRIVITAAKEKGIKKGVGIDIDPNRINEARANAKNAGVQDRVEFRQEDLFKTDFKEADVITMYLLESVNRKLRPKLLEQLRPGTRLVSHDFTMGEWKPDEQREVSADRTHSIYYWVVPANVSGTWQIEDGTGSQPLKVDLKQQFQEVQGEIVGDGQGRELKEVKVEGDQLTLIVAQQGGTKTYTGTVDGDKITLNAEGESGQVTAKRQEGTKREITPTDEKTAKAGAAG